MRKLISLAALMFCSCISFASADSSLLHQHVLNLTAGPGFRNINDTGALNRTAHYIYGEFAKYGAPQMQHYGLNQKIYSNVILSFGPVAAPRIIAGAHYDVCGDQMGADDNASGVAGLLELARLFAKIDTTKMKYRIDLVAYTLEEPPAFETADMGSAVHAKYLSDNGIAVKGMISIEMIGYFKDGRNTQTYPAGIFKLFYGTRANYITIVRKFGRGAFSRKFTRVFKRQDDIITKVFKGPVWIPGVDFSDHRNYWALGWDALMITDTSFYRNANYHERTDTPDTLDYGRMTTVVSSIYETLLQMSSS